MALMMTCAATCPEPQLFRRHATSHSRLLGVRIGEAQNPGPACGYDENASSSEEETDPLGFSIHCHDELCNAAVDEDTWMQQLLPDDAAYDDDDGFGMAFSQAQDSDGEPGYPDDAECCYQGAR